MKDNTLKKRKRNLNFSFSAAIVCALIAVTVNTYAQEREDVLDPVNITASLQATRSSSTGRNIITVKGEQFNNLPVHSLDELLRYLPGVEVQQRGAMGSQSDIVLRGATFGQVLVIIDGVRVNDPNTGHFSAYIPVAPAEIDRIEILKGASSAVYGSEAVGGVINIITKSFAAAKGQHHHGLTASGAAGEYNLVSANLGGFVQGDNTAVGGGILSNNSDGQPQRGSRSFFNNHTASISLHQFIGDNWTLGLRSAYDNRRFSAQNFYTSFVSDTAREQVSTFWNQAMLAYQKGDNSLQLDLGYRGTKDNYAYNTVGAPNENKSELFQSTVTFRHRFSGATTLITGGQFQNKSIRSNDRGNHNLDQAAAFAVLNQTIAANLFLSPAIRVDYHQLGGTELVPQLNLSWHKADLQLRASAGKTIRNADFTERFNNYNKTFVSGGSIGNPDLNAERSFCYEAGADYFLKSILRISATLFRRDEKNVIDWVSTPYSAMPRKDNLSSSGTYALATNVADVHTTGAELDLRFTKNISAKQSVYGMAGATWLDTKTSETAPSFYILSHARFLVNTALNYRYKNLSIGTTAIYKKRKPVQASAINVKVDEQCFMLNAKADYVVMANFLSAFVEVDNILDHGCRDLVNSVTPSRWLMGGIKLNIGK